jgi:hypothetical protein
MVPPLLLADAAEKAFPAIQRERGTANRRRTCCEWRQVQELPPSPWTSSGAHRFLCHRSCADEESDDLERKGFPGTFHHGSGNGISVDTSGRHRALLECRQLLPGRRTGSWPAVPVTNCRKSSARDSVCTEQRASVREWRTLRWYSPSTIHSKPDRPKSSRLLARSRCRVERAPFPERTSTSVRPRSPSRESTVPRSGSTFPLPGAHGGARFRSARRRTITAVWPCSTSEEIRSAQWRPRPHAAPERRWVPNPAGRMDSPHRRR